MDDAIITIRSDLRWQLLWIVLDFKLNFETCWNILFKFGELEKRNCYAKKWHEQQTDLKIDIRVYCVQWLPNNHRRSSTETAGNEVDDEVGGH